METIAGGNLAWAGLAVLGLVFSLIGLRELWYGYRSLKWPSCEGTILKSEVKKSRGSDGEADFNPRVIYVYSVGGQEFVSKRVAFHGWGGTTAAASAAVCLRYPIGSTVRVFYNPCRAACSTLETGYGPGNFLVIGIGAVLGFAGTWAYLANN
jgi:hypothetical protein